MRYKTKRPVMPGTNRQPAPTGAACWHGECMNTPQPNTSVCHGTHRPQDLIPAFFNAIREYDFTAYAGMTSCTPPFVPAHVYDEGDDSPWWYSDECREVLEVLFYHLGGLSPEGCYFGAHGGDGSDFGWWEYAE